MSSISARFANSLLTPYSSTCSDMFCSRLFFCPLQSSNKRTIFILSARI